MSKEDMHFFNSFEISGNLTSNIRSYNDDKFVTFSLCQNTTKSFKNKEGFFEAQNVAEYFDFCASDGVAQKFLEELGKKAVGSYIKVTGSIKKTKSKKDGKYYTNLVVKDFDVLIKKINENANMQEYSSATTELYGISTFVDDEIPF